MLMPIELTADEVAELQNRYSYLTNYQADDLDAPIDPLTYVDSNGDRLLHIAVQLGDARTAELLLRAGIDVNQLGDMGCTALHYASMLHKADVIRILLANGAATNIVNDFGKLPGEGQPRR
jgi:ankyrin repeat protein